MPANGPFRVLLLGGTAEARTVASLLVGQGIDVVTSLAGVTSSPVPPEGTVRTGGFGGVDGLVAYLAREHISLLADATHPYAAVMSAHAAEAAARAGISCVRLERPAWQPLAGERWCDVDSVSDAARQVPSGRRVLLSIGAKEAGLFLVRDDIGGVARMIEPPVEPATANWQILLERPPFTLERELDLMRRAGVDTLVTKNSGGGQVAAKLSAARQLGLDIWMVRRPPKPAVPAAPNATGLVDLIMAHAAGKGRS